MLLRAHLDGAAAAAAARAPGWWCCCCCCGRTWMVVVLLLLQAHLDGAWPAALTCMVQLCIADTPRMLLLLLLLAHRH
jgi:hypothetical protein